MNQTQITRIFNDIVKSGTINFNKINKTELNAILEASYEPLYIATIWKMYKYLYENSKFGQKLFWISCGNTIGLLKYNGHIPWDDDIDIGFEIDNGFNEYIDFLIECIKIGFIVNLNFKKQHGKELSWYNNVASINLIFDHDKTPIWEHMREMDFRKLMNKNPNDFYFANITLREECWLKIAARFNMKEIYKWNGEHITTPWMDVIPHVKKNNQYHCHLIDPTKNIPHLSTKFDYHNFLTVPGKFPVNLMQVILNQYNEDRSYINFKYWDTIYSHVKNTQIILHYDNNHELHKFVRVYIDKFNEALLYYMDKMTNSELIK